MISELFRIVTSETFVHSAKLFFVEIGDLSKIREKKVSHTKTVPTAKGKGCFDLFLIFF